MQQDRAAVDRCLVIALPRWVWKEPHRGVLPGAACRAPCFCRAPDVILRRVGTSGQLGKEPWSERAGVHDVYGSTQSKRLSPW